jgi:hypothetical protein
MQPLYMAPVERLVAPAVVIDVTEAAANVYSLENRMNPGCLPATGATIIALPMKIAGDSGPAGACHCPAALTRRMPVHRYGMQTDWCNA